MIAVDSNILIYAYRTDTPFYSAACANLRRLVEGRSVWAVPIAMLA